MLFKKYLLKAGIIFSVLFSYHVSYAKSPEKPSITSKKLDKYSFDDLCGTTYNKMEGRVTSIAASSFNWDTPNGGGVVVTIDNNLSRYIYKNSDVPSYDYTYNPMVKVATISLTLGTKVKVCYEDVYMKVIQLQK